MRKFELALGIASIIAVKWDILFLLPGGGLLVIWFLLISSMFYFFFGFAIFNNIRFRRIFKKESYKDSSARNIFSGILAGWSFSIAILGILFKIMSWTGANFNLTVAIISFIILLVFLFLKYKQFNLMFKTIEFKRIALITIISLVFLILPEPAMINFKHRDHPAYAAALIKANSNRDNVEYQKELERQRNIAFPE